MTETYKSLAEKPYQSLYLQADTTIPHSVEKVWSHVLNIGGWMSAHRLEPIAGEPGKVGFFERVYPAGLGDEFGYPRYHLYGITEIIPQKYIALEVFPEKGGSYGSNVERMSLDSVVLTAVGEQTHLFFVMIDLTLGEVDEAFRQRQQREHSLGQALIRQYFDNLKALVENSA